MNNKIMKSYMKKILRSEAFVSVIIVFVLAIGIIGTSYALYMDVDTDSDYQLVKSGDLSISFDSGDGVIDVPILPLEDVDVIDGKMKPESYTFSILNTGSYDADYNITIEDLGENTVELEYVNYILCKENCSDISTEDIKSLGDGTLLYSDSIAASSSTADTYILKLWLDSSYDGSQEKQLELQIVVEAKSQSMKLLKDTIMNDKRIVKNTGTPTFTSVETEEVGMYSAPDDYGTSWYFRGAQSYNYVNFAGFTWRVVRINGDGSIRLILDGTLDKVYRKNEDGTTSATPAGSISVFNSSNYDNADVGYMYGNFTGNSTSYDSAHENNVSSTIKEVVDLFYTTYIESDANNYHYQSYLSDTLFCGDKTLASNYSTSTSGFGNVSTEYSALERLESNDNPTLECAKSAGNTYSRYTSKIDTSTETTKGVSVNNDLSYPIALLSADEIIFAGGNHSMLNHDYYLSNAYHYDIPIMGDYWWTMTPKSYPAPEVFVGSVVPDVTDFSLYSLTTEGLASVRPVINLKSNSVFTGGNGTYESPYEIK